MIENKVIIYTANDGKTRIDVKLEEETLWLTQAQMCELYQTSESNVSEHIKHIFEEGELDRDSVVRNFRTTASDGKEYIVSHYNLDMIIALGYRVRSIIATRFRQWATERLKEYIVKGFTLDDDRLKKLGGGSYWKELLERIRDIRASEKVLYLDPFCKQFVTCMCRDSVDRGRIDHKRQCSCLDAGFEWTEIPFP